MAALRSTFGDLLEPGFNQIYNDAYKETDRVFTQIFRMQDSRKQDERDSAVTGFGYLTKKMENAPIDYEDPLEMYHVVYIHFTWAKGFKVSKEMFDDDQYNIMNSKPDQLGRAARRTEENQANQVFANGFTTTNFIGGDGKALCSTVHPRSDGGSSQSNASSTGLVLSETNYETGKIAMRHQLDDKGMKIDVKPTDILIPIELEKTANIVFNSPLRSGTADNDVNFYKNEVRIIPWIYFSSTTNWFLIDRDQHKVKWFWRERSNFKQDTTFETDAALFKVRERFSNGFSDWRGIWGSLGDGAAYSG